MRKHSLTVQQRNEPILERIHQIKAEHPFRGYRQICAHLKYIDQVDVN